MKTACRSNPNGGADKNVQTWRRDRLRLAGFVPPAADPDHRQYGRLNAARQQSRTQQHHQRARKGPRNRRLGPSAAIKSP